MSGILEMEGDGYPSSYNQGVFRQSAALCLTIFVLTGCADSLHNKQQVQAAIVDRLQSHSGLDLKQLDVTTTAVSFEKNKAYATVAFHPKGDPAINSGMTMKYTLEEQSGKWVVVKVGDTHGQGLPGHGFPGSGSPGNGLSGNGSAGFGSVAPGASLPPGHPQLNSTSPQAGTPQPK